MHSVTVMHSGSAVTVVVFGAGALVTVDKVSTHLWSSQEVMVTILVCSLVLVTVDKVSTHLFSSQDVMVTISL